MSHTGVLCSYWYFKGFDFNRFPNDVPLILDSGAFSAYTSGGSVDINDFARWVNGLSRPYDFAFNLDVLGDAPQSLANWRYLRSCGVTTTPVLHFGSKPEDELPAYLAEGADRLSLGGLVGGGATPQALAWTAYVFRWLRNEGLTHIPVHGLGVHMRSRLARFPWATTDSSSPGMAWRFARLSLWTLNRRWVTVPLDGRSLYKYGCDVRSYGFDPAEVSTSTPANREKVARFVARIEDRAAMEYPYRIDGKPAERFVASPSTHYIPHIADELARANRYIVDAAASHLVSIADELADRCIAGSDKTHSTGLHIVAQDLSEQSKG